MKGIKLLIVINDWINATHSIVAYCATMEYMEYIYNGILFHNKKEWSTYTCYNMDDPQIHAK